MCVGRDDDRLTDNRVREEPIVIIHAADVEDDDIIPTPRDEITIMVSPGWWASLLRNTSSSRGFSRSSRIERMMINPRPSFAPSISATSRRISTVAAQPLPIPTRSAVNSVVEQRSASSTA